MRCDYPRCRNLATVQAVGALVLPGQRYYLCDVCQDAVRVTLKNRGIDPDDEEALVRFVPCPTL